jgi:hypothetical protein
MGISIRKRDLIPEDTPITARIKAPKIVNGNFSRQVEADIAVLSGEYKGTEFTDWFSFQKDKKTKEEYIAYNGKLYQLLSLGENIDGLENEELEKAIEEAVKKLDGFVISGRVDVLENKEKTKKRNALQPGSFGPPSEDMDEEFEQLSL